MMPTIACNTWARRKLVNGKVHAGKCAQCGCVVAMSTVAKAREAQGERVVCIPCAMTAIATNRIGPFDERAEARE